MTTIGEMYAAYEAEREALPFLEDVTLEIVAATVKETKAGDGLKLVPRFRVVSGEYAGREFFAGSWATTPPAKSMTMQTLRALGLTEEAILGAESHEEIAALLEGRRFVATVQQREWGGRIWNDIPLRWIRAAGESGGE
jgi:hypothetical protein